MDDGELDDLVKKKLGNYVDPVYDEGAFDDLASRLVVAPAPSFFARHWTSMALAASVMLTGVSVYLFLQRAETKTIVTNTIQYDSLLNVIHELRESQASTQANQTAREPVQVETPVVVQKVVPTIEGSDVQTWLGSSSQSSNLKALMNARVVARQ